MRVGDRLHHCEAESVAVYTRSGQPVGDAERHATTFNPPARSADAAAYRPGAYDTPSSYAEARRVSPAHAAPSTTSATAAHINSVVNGTAQLPAYVLRPESYDDVETVVRRVRTRQPVVLVFVGVRTEAQATATARAAASDIGSDTACFAASADSFSIVRSFEALIVPSENPLHSSTQRSRRVSSGCSFLYIGR